MNNFFVENFEQFTGTNINSFKHEGSYSMYGTYDKESEHIDTEDIQKVKYPRFLRDFIKNRKKKKNM